MKILFLASDLNRLGGIQSYNRGLLESLRGEGMDILIVELGNNGLFSKFAFILKFVISFLRLKPDFVFCSHINFSPIGLFFKKFFGRDYIIFTHGIEVWKIGSALKRKSLARAKIVVTVSEFTKRKLLEEIPAINGKIFLLPNFVDGDKFFIKKEDKAELLEKYGLPRNSRIILTVARLASSEKYKGYDEIIRALPKIVSEVPDVAYVIVGEGDDSARISRLVRELGLGERVALTGRVSDAELLDYFNLCDVFAMPSLGEGFGIVFLNALACGKPVVAGDKDASREAVLNGELGILVDPQSEPEIIRAIESVLSGRADKRFFDGRFLRDKVLGVFGFDKFKEWVRILLNELQG